MVIWEELSRYVYFGVTALVIIPMKNKWDKWREHEREIAKKVASLEVDVNKVSEKQDDQALRFDKLERKLDENQAKSETKNDMLFALLNKIDVQTAVNTAKIESNK